MAISSKADAYLKSIEPDFIPSVGEYSVGVGLAGEIAAYGGVDFSAGYIRSQNANNQRNHCGFISFCAGVGSAGGKASLSGIFSSSKTSSGVSSSTCMEGSGSAFGGVGVSQCEDFQSNSSTTSFSTILGAQVALSAKQCVQLTFCSDFK